MYKRSSLPERIARQLPKKYIYICSLREAGDLSDIGEPVSTLWT